MQQMVLGELSTNGYLLWDENGEGVLIDPADDAPRILALLKQHSVQLRTVLLTHAHFDHMLAVGEVLRETGATLALHEEDAPALADSRRNLMALFGSGVFPTLSADRLLHEGDVIEVGNISLCVFHTPGHTVGSCCYYEKAQGWLFSGDTLFAGSVGRTDFPGGNAVKLLDSLRRLVELPDKTKVYPGHDAMTTIGEERLYNPFIG